MSNTPHRVTDDAIARFLRTRSADPDLGLLDDIVRTVGAMPQDRPWFGLRPVVLPRRTLLIVAAALLVATMGAVAVGSRFLQPVLPSPDSRSGPTISGQMWPQSSLEEVREAQELADAGDPDYTWQLDAKLAAEEDPYGAEILARFIEEELGWEEFTSGFAGTGYTYPDGGGRYDGLMFIRCAPGQTNPLSPLYADAPPEIRGCAPTIDELTYETVSLSVVQPVRRGPSGIWVVERWEMPQQPASEFPGSLSELVYPGFGGRVEQVVPPSDTEVTALLEAFLRARVDGAGAEQYVHREPEVSPFADTGVPILYATTGGAPYERSEIERVLGPGWPNGVMEYQVRLFAEDETVVEQYFHVVRHDGQLGLVYGYAPNGIPTTENGQSVALPYSVLDGEVTFAAAPPWGETLRDRTSMILGGVGRGSAVQFTMFMIAADPRTGMGCEAGPPAADVEALVRSIRSNPDLEATAAVAASVGGIDAVRVDVAAPGRLEVGECAPMVLERIWAGPDGRTRLYLLELPEGMSARVLAIAISALDSEFELVVEEAAPVLDSIEFHAP